MYVSPNFITKKALKAAVKVNDYVTIYQPGPFGDDARKDGVFAVEGPHYPDPHTWYAQVEVENNIVKRVIS